MWPVRDQFEIHEETLDRGNHIYRGIIHGVHDLDLLFDVRRSRHNRRLVQEYFWSNKTIFQA